jgi:hypothetical protein
MKNKILFNLFCPWVEWMDAVNLYLFTYYYFFEKYFSAWELSINLVTVKFTGCLLV